MTHSVRPFVKKWKHLHRRLDYQLLSRKMSLSSSLDSQEGTRLDLREWLRSSLLKISAKGCNNSQQCCDLQCIMGRIQPTRPWVTWVPSPNNVERSGQTDPTMLGYTLAIMEQKECWELFQTLRSNCQKHTTTWNKCAKGRNRSHPTMLGVVGRQSYIRLHRAVDMAMDSNSFLFTMWQFSHLV